ncbi:MAG: hypothetical protein FJ303_10435 [Planctomycetes bacterium]|nr:hypothetical protein [Planctomycetota bacterium]
MVKISAVATPGPFVRTLDSVRKDGFVGLTTFHSFGPTLEDTLTISASAKDDSLDKKIADELDKAKAKSGDVQISLYWTSKNDLDLHVICPSGEKIWYDHKNSRCGGALDVDRNARESLATMNAVENVFWPTGKAPRGKYKVYVDFFGQHHNAGRPGYPDPASFSVRVVAQGRTQLFHGSVSMRGSTRYVRVTEFELP